MTRAAPVVLYGGTFDPIHAGHVQVALTVAKALHCPVSLLPAADPPHRAPPGASAAERAAMVELAIAGHELLRLDARELRRPGPSFTIDTLAEVRAEVGPHVPLIWLLGADAVAGLDRWNRWRELFGVAHLLAFEREGHPLSVTALRKANAELATELAGRWRALEDLSATPAGSFADFRPAQGFPESATEVRRRLAAGGDWPALLAPAVADYIRVHGLYRTQRV